MDEDTPLVGVPAHAVAVPGHASATYYFAIVTPETSPVVSGATMGSRTARSVCTLCCSPPTLADKLADKRLIRSDVQTVV